MEPAVIMDLISADQAGLTGFHDPPGFRVLRHRKPGRIMGAAGSQPGRGAGPGDQTACRHPRAAGRPAARGCL